MNMSLEEFINNSKPHEFKNSAPPSNSIARHQWESMLLYSVKNKLKNDVKIIDYGSGFPGTLKRSLYARYPNATYYGLDIELKDLNLDKDFLTDKCYVGNISSLDTLINKVDCVIAGSVLTHLSWEESLKFLNKLGPLFNNGGELGFSFFKGDTYNTYVKVPQDLHGSMFDEFYHVVELPIKYIEDYCKDKKLKLDFLDFSFNLDHHIEYENKIFDKQYFCNIKQ